LNKKLWRAGRGNRKGCCKILWERGFVDVENLSAYTVDGRKDAFGVVQKETSLKHLMSNCTDFEEEEWAAKWG
jgi:hypothetical protein